MAAAGDALGRELEALGAEIPVVVLSGEYTDAYKKRMGLS